MTITINPGVQFGRPCIEGTRVPADCLAGAVFAGESSYDVADDYGVSRLDVITACWWEVESAIIRPPSYRDAQERRYVARWGAWAHDNRHALAQAPDPPAAAEDPT